MAAQLIPFPRPGSNDNHDLRPPQPGLRSFIVYDELPTSCIAVEVKDSSQSPHLRRGDFAIVDTSDTEPAHGDMFAIRWGNGELGLIVAKLRPGRYGCGENGAMIDTSLWWAVWQGRMTAFATGKAGPLHPWADGPYREGYFEEMLAGRVVGILEPDFRAQLRRAA